MRFLTLFFVLFSYILVAQEVVWFDAQWNETSENQADYYRPTPTKVKKGYWVIDYYKNGAVKREGYAKKIRRNKKGFEGLVVEYFINGKTAKSYNYKRGVLHGVSKEYFSTGELKTQTRYRNGKREGVWKEFYKSGKIKTKGKYHEGEKVGVWKTFYKNDNSSFLDY